MNKTILGHITAFITVLIWGMTFVSTKVLLDSFSPAEILFIRFTIGYIILFLIYPKIDKILPFKYEILFIMSGFFGIFLYLLLENTALSYSLASNVGLLVSISPFFSALLAYFFLKEEKIQPVFFFSATLSFIGVALIIFNGSFIFNLNPKGDILALAAALSWAVYSMFIKKISFIKINPVIASRKIFFYGLMFTLPYLLYKGIDMEKSHILNMKNILNILFLGGAASALCFVTWSKAVKLIGTVKTSIYIYMIPVMTVISSVIILNENITIYSLLGIIFILAGLLSLQLHK